MKKHLLFIAFIILFAVPAILPLFRPGFFPTDDGEWMMIRFSAFHQAFRDGQFPVRFLGRLNHGYGYPVANFLYPGFMYLAEPFHVIGFGFVNSVKIVIGLSMVGSGIFSYLWLTKRFNNFASLVGSLFYLYTPYHLYDLYKRGSVGELLALAVVPFVLWQLERKSLFWSSVGLAGLIVSHNTLAILFIPLIVLYKFILEKEKNKKDLILHVSYFLFLSFGLSAFFWLPAVAELQYTRFSSVQVSNIREYFATTSLAGVSSLVLLGMTVTFLNRRHDSASQKKLLYFFFGFSFFSLFFSSEASLFFWNLLPANFVQFPFRFLSILIVSISFIAAYMFSLLQKIKLAPVAVVLFVALIYSALPYLQPKEYFDKGEGFYSTNEDTTTVKNEYMPVWVKNEPVKHFSAKVENLEFENLVYNNTHISFEAICHPELVSGSQNDSSGEMPKPVRHDDQCKAQVSTIYYPGWRAFVDNKEVQIDYSNEQGLIEVPIKEGTSRIQIVFGETPLRLAADILSLVTFFALITISIKKRKII